MFGEEDTYFDLILKSIKLKNKKKKEEKLIIESIAASELLKKNV